MHSLAFMEITYIIISILTPLILINIVVYIVKKEIIKTTLRRSLKVFLIAISIFSGVIDQSPSARVAGSDKVL